MGTLSVIWQGKCPRCRKGAIFKGRIRMNTQCAECDLLFDREPGYFLGAMVISYAISIVFYMLIYQFLKRLTSQSLILLLTETFVIYLFFVPFVFRYSRILWIYFDQAVDPQK